MVIIKWALTLVLISKVNLPHSKTKINVNLFFPNTSIVEKMGEDDYTVERVRYTSPTDALKL